MQMINTGINSGNSTKLQEFVALLNEVAVPKYFSGVELDTTHLDADNYTLVNFYVDNVLSMQFKIFNVNATSTIRIILPNQEWGSISTDGFAPGHRLLITDSAIVFFAASRVNIDADDYVLYQSPIIICKSTDGQTMCVYFGTASGLVQRTTMSTSASSLFQHVFGEQAVGDNSFYWYYGASGNTAGFETAVAIPTNSGRVADGVYHAISRNIYETKLPFLFTNGGESYCGIAYNNYIIKTT